MRPSHVSYAFLTSFLVIVFFLQWSPWALSTPSPSRIDYYIGNEVGIRGVIDDEPDTRGRQTRFVVRAELLKTPERTISIQGRIQVTRERTYPEPQYGEEIIAQGTLSAPEEEEATYLRRLNVHAVMEDPMIERTGVHRGNRIYGTLFRMRSALEHRLTELLPEPHASLLAGLLLGSRGGMSKDLSDAFKTTGLTHIVAISGFNISILVAVIGALLFWLPLKWQLLPLALMIVAFTLLTGASASAVRAAIMGILGAVAIHAGRQKAIRLITLWTAAAMTAWNPEYLWHDAGFQLSFLALIGVMEVSPLVERCLRWMPELHGIRSALCMTLAAQAMASPWILYLFGQFSFIAPVSNLLAPPLVPVAMLLGSVSLGASVFSMTLGRIAALAAWLPLQWIVGVAETLSRVPFAAIMMEPIGSGWIIAYYGLLAYQTYRYNVRCITGPGSLTTSVGVRDGNVNACETTIVPGRSSALNFGSSRASIAGDR